MKNYQLLNDLKQIPLFKKVSTHFMDKKLGRERYKMSYGIFVIMVRFFNRLTNHRIVIHT